MGSVGPTDEEVVVVAASYEDEEAEGGGLTAVLDFDVLCATVALQTQGFSVEKQRRKEGTAAEEEEDEEAGLEFGGVQRMWEGDIVDCFEDRRIAIEAACCPCYRFGKNMRRANLGSCFFQATAYLIFIVAALLNFTAFSITNRHRFLYAGIASIISAGFYLGYFRTRIKKQFNIRGGGSSLDDYLNHLICPPCTLCQESRTLEMNNVQNGIWHGRGDTICLASSGEGSKAFVALRQPPLFPPRSPELCSMERASIGFSSEHSWNTNASHSEPLVP
ncbi:hypothetical protein Cni_G13940 [Canna indica]|uniref:Uncharacterized protein n=1 Tax=Canna indica TaxID=4628 RepID=A0AAQ3KDJ9_9LILI|nr:hypothetical protein Cni_G13940 [Canna indica]